MEVLSIPVSESPIPFVMRSVWPHSSNKRDKVIVVKENYVPLLSNLGKERVKKRIAWRPMTGANAPKFETI